MMFFYWYFVVLDSDGDGLGDYMNVVVFDLVIIWGFWIFFEFYNDLWDVIVNLVVWGIIYVVIKISYWGSDDEVLGEISVNLCWFFVFGDYFLIFINVCMIGI